MGIEGLWPLANSLTEPKVCNVTNRLDTAAHFMYGVAAQRSLPSPPPIPDPSTDPSNSVNNDDDSPRRSSHNDDTPSPVLPTASTSTAQYAPIASTSDLNRQPLHPTPPSSSLIPAPLAPPRPLPPRPRPYVDRPIATVKPIFHFVIETASFDENEKRSMLDNITTSSQPLPKFITQHQYRVIAVIIKLADEYGRSFPGSMFSFIFEGLSTLKKKREAEARARKQVPGQQKGEWKAEHTVYIKARKEKKNEKKAEAIGRKREEKRTGIKPKKDGKNSGKGEGEGEGGMDIDEKNDVAKPKNASKDAPQRIQSHQVPRVRAPEVTNIPSKYLAQQFVNTPITHVRYLQANGEGERGLTPGARISTHVLNDEDREHIEYVKYAPGADPASFPQAALYSVSWSPDGDQVPLIEETVFGFIMNEPYYGGIVFKTLAIEAPPDSPQHYELPKNVKKRIKSIRIVITHDFFHDTRIFPLPTIECRASMPVYIGNDTAEGGYGIGWGTFTNGKHSELMELSSRPSLVNEYEAAPVEMEEEYLVLVRHLRQSQYIIDLTLKSFIESRETNLGRNIDVWDKTQHVADYIKSLKAEGNQKRAERRLRTQQQTERVGNEKSRRRNHPYFPNHKWPKPITQDGGGGSSNAQDGGGGPSNARDRMEEDRDEIRGVNRRESEDRVEGERGRTEEIVDEETEAGRAGGAVNEGVKSKGKGKEKATEDDPEEEEDVTFSRPFEPEPASSSSDQASDDDDEWEDEDPEEPIARPLSPPPPPTQAPIGFQMPTKSTSWGYSRVSKPLFHSQIHRAENKIHDDNLLPIPQEAPQDPPLLPFKAPKGKERKAKKVKLSDYGCPYVVRPRSVQSAYRASCVRSRLTLNRKQQLELKDAFDRTDATILSTGVVTVAAVGRTVSQWFDVLVKEEPRNLCKLNFKGFDMQNLVIDVASMRAGVDVETGVVEVDDTAGSDQEPDTVSETVRRKQLIRQACNEEERSSGQRFRSRDPATRLEVTLSKLVTNLNAVIPARLVGIKPFEYLLRSLLSSPETTLQGLDGYFKILFNEHAKKKCFSEASNGLSSESAAVWSRLHRNERVREPLVKLLVQFILSETSREYAENLRDWADDTLPQHLLNAIDTAFAQLSSRPVTLDSPSTNDVFASQATLNDARDRLGVVLCSLKRFIPNAYLEMAAFTVPSTDEDEIRTALGDNDFLPTSSTIHALVTRTAASEPCDEYWEGTRGFKLAILAIAHSQKINYGPTSFNFDASTTHRYVKIPQKAASNTGGKKLQNRPALLDVLRDHLNNAEKSIRRTEKAFAAAQQAANAPPSVPSNSSAALPSSIPNPSTPPTSTPKQPLPPLNLPDFVSDAEAWVDEDNSEDPVTIRSKSEYQPPRILARYLHRQHRRGRKLVNDQGTSTLADEFNKMTFLSSVERIAVLRYLAPELKFVESLAGNPHYKLTNKLDRYGWAIFVVNDKLVRRDLRLTYEFYTTLLPHQAPWERDMALNKLRHEVLPLRFNPDQEGNLVLQGYDRTPTSVNLMYVDPRRAKYAPASYLPTPPKPSKAKYSNKKSSSPEEDPKKMDVKSKTFIDIVEYVVKDKLYKALQKDVIYESVRTHKKTKQGRIVYSHRLIAPFLGPDKKWTKARKLRRRKPAQLPSTVDPLKPLLLRPDYKDHDFPNRGLFGKPFKTDEEQDVSDQIAQQNLELAQYRLHGPLPPGVIRIICGTDAGQWILGAITWYCPESQECFLDMLKRNAFVGRDRTAQHVRDELSSELKEKDRDDKYRSLNPNLAHEKEKDGAVKSILEYNKLNPTDQLSTDLARPSQLVNVYNHERQVDHEREMRKIVAQQVSTAFPYVRGRTYQMSFFLSCDNLPTTGVYGRNLYSTYERMLCEELNSREYIDLRVFMMPEAFTSSHCIYCDKPCVFHPESLETGQTLPRLTVCNGCTKIHHRDALASQLFVQAAYLTTLTGIYRFSPAHEIGTYGGEIEPRLSDHERRRCRRTELDLMMDFWARDCLRKQNNAFDPPADPSNVEAETREDRNAVRAAIEAPDDAEKLPKIRQKKVESLPEIARLQGDLSAANYRRMADIAAQNPHLQAPTQDDESSG